MPWSETTPRNERLRFIADVLEREADEMAVLCRRYGISRKTGYKWLARYVAGGPAALAERSPSARTARGTARTRRRPRRRTRSARCGAATRPGARRSCSPSSPRGSRPWRSPRRARRPRC